GDATDNTVVYSGGDVQGAIYGGYANNGATTDNTVTLKASFGGKVIGGNTMATGNTLDVQSGGLTVGSVENFEQYRFATSALNTGTPALTLTNQPGTLTVKADEVDVDIRGAGLALGQPVTLIESNQNIDLRGSSEQTDWLDGAVGALKTAVYELTQSVTTRLEAAFSELYLYGDPKDGTPGSGGQRAQDNKLTVSSGDVATAAFGGRSNVANATVSGNTVEMSGGTLAGGFQGMFPGALFGGFADDGSANDNTATVTGGSYDKEMAVIGGGAGKGNATDNTVNVSGGAFNKYTYVTGGGAQNNASGNTVTLSSGTFNITEISGGTAYDGNATGNAVILNGGTFQNDAVVFGGWISGGGGNATGNTVTLGANFKGASKLSLYGGMNGVNEVSDNTLAVQGKNVEVANIYNFENLYFILPGDIQPGDIVLEATDSYPTQFAARKTNIGIAMAGSSKPLATGDTVTLLKNDAGLQNASGGQLVQGTDYALVDLKGKSIPGMQGFSLNYTFELSNTRETLDATVAQFTPDPT
ncbi:MAG: hypothetical protein IKU14_09970, partial [Rhodocyclaceae bacterium]|nr:hypothetical protein [Rhodocyclaceae bacterium]